LANAQHQTSVRTGFIGEMTRPTQTLAFRDRN
jgi:hypothetical protein